MKLKLDDKGNVVLDNGVPVWIADDGKEVAYDVPRLVADLSRVNGESAGRRKEIDGLNEKLKAFEGLDPEAAKKALDTVKNLDDKKLVDAQKVEELKRGLMESAEAKLQSTIKNYDAQIKERDEKLVGKDKMVHNLLIKGAFDSSQFIQDKTVLPPDIAFDTFGKHFSVEEVDGKLVSVAKLDGQPIFSRKNPGQYADTEEAIEAIVEKYPFRDRIVKGANQSGGGTPPGSPGGGGGGANQNMRSTDKIAAGLKQLKT